MGSQAGIIAARSRPADSEVKAGKDIVDDVALAPQFPLADYKALSMVYALAHNLKIDGRVGALDDSQLELVQNSSSILQEILERNFAEASPPGQEDWETQEKLVEQMREAVLPLIQKWAHETQLSQAGIGLANLLSNPRESINRSRAVPTEEFYADYFALQAELKLSSYFDLAFTQEQLNQMDLTNMTVYEFLNAYQALMKKE